jgi:hypothetical protein
MSHQVITQELNLNYLNYKVNFDTIISRLFHRFIIYNFKTGRML